MTCSVRESVWQSPSEVMQTENADTTKAAQIGVTFITGSIIGRLLLVDSAPSGNGRCSFPAYQAETVLGSDQYSPIY